MKKVPILETVAHYAKRKKISLTWAYKQIKLGNVDSEKIDGVTFVKNKVKK